MQVNSRAVRAAAAACARVFCVYEAAAVTAQRC